MTTGEPRLLDQVRDRIRAKHYSLRTEEAYVAWIVRFIRFCGMRHPRELGEPDLSRFLTHLAVNRRVAASTQNQALAALLFLYREVLDAEIGWVDGMVRAKRPARMPVVLSRAEAGAVLAQLAGTKGLIARLLYGAGLRLNECLSLRVKDVDFERRQILVRDGKGQQDRVTVLPDATVTALRRHRLWGSG